MGLASQERNCSHTSEPLKTEERSARGSKLMAIVHGNISEPVTELPVPITRILHSLVHFSFRARQLLAHHAAHYLTLSSSARSTERARRLHVTSIIENSTCPSPFFHSLFVISPIPKKPDCRPRSSHCNAFFAMLLRQAGIVRRCAGSWE